MATVYLAHDVKHDRKVALKVLRPELAAVIGAERFLQEIKVTANLQHSHILPLYDSGAAEGFLFYVMPYVEGENLRTLLSREKQLGVDEAVSLARAVAAALEHAHRQGVIHRDIKPENILLRDGDPLIADFGIALALSHAGGTRLTETGLSIGTPHYMSPEQAMGDRELDARSDVYSLGAVLYEMLTGEPPYTGGTAQAIVAKVITEKAPPVTAIRDTVPSHVAAVIKKALNKLPADRFHSAAAFAEALASPGFGGALDHGISVAVRARPARTYSERTLLGVTVVAGLLLGAALWGWLRPGPTVELSRFAMIMPADAPLDANHDGNALAIAPDGRRFVYTGPDRQLYVRELDQLEARPLPGTESARAPFFSPDGEWVAFEANGELRKVALSGGPPLKITDVESDFRGGAWGEDDAIVLAPTTTQGLHRVLAAGGAVEPFTALDTAAGTSSHRWPTLLPDGQGAVFTVYGGSNEEASLAVADLATGEVTPLPLRGLRPQWAGSGHLVYGAADGSIMAVPFDPSRRQVTGAPVSLLENVMVRISVVSEFSISRAGHLIYLSGQPPELSLTVADGHGEEEVLVEELRVPEGPRASPNGRHIAVSQIEGGNTDVWSYDLLQRTMTRMTFEGNNRYPAWSPDGRRIAYSHSPENSPGRAIWSVAADGSGAPEELFNTDGDQWEVQFMPNGQDLIVRSIGQGTGRDLWWVPASAEPEPLVVTEFNERSHSISPDGRWLAYASNESGRDEVYVRPIPGPGGKRQVSADGGAEPRWALDGSGLFYRGHDGNFYFVEIRTEPALQIGQRRMLFEDRYVTNPSHTNFDLLPDGRFVFLKGSDTPTSVVLVMNWFEELRERVDGSR
jgi:serine/threonine-protein kinase